MESVTAPWGRTSLRSSMGRRRMSELVKSESSFLFAAMRAIESSHSRSAQTII